VREEGYEATRNKGRRGHWKQIEEGEKGGATRPTLAAGRRADASSGAVEVVGEGRKTT